MTPEALHALAVSELWNAYDRLLEPFIFAMPKTALPSVNQATAAAKHAIYLVELGRVMEAVDAVAVACVIERQFLPAATHWPQLLAIVNRYIGLQAA